MWAQTHEHKIITWAEVKSRMLNWLGHPGTRLLPYFYFIGSLTPGSRVLLLKVFGFLGFFFGIFCLTLFLTPHKFRLYSTYRGFLFACFIYALVFWKMAQGKRSKNIGKVIKRSSTITLFLLFPTWTCQSCLLPPCHLKQGKDTVTFTPFLPWRGS